MGVVWSFTAMMLCALLIGGARLAHGRRSRHSKKGAHDEPGGSVQAERDAKLLKSRRMHPSASVGFWDALALGTPDALVPAPPPAPRAPSLPHLHARARVVFARTEDRRFTLDCVIIEASGDGVNAPPGLPVTLTLGVLETPWMAVHVEAMMERWADAERIIDLEVRDSGAAARATIESASSRVVLPLTAVAGLD